jgi:hypothetical protein
LQKPRNAGSRREARFFDTLLRLSFFFVGVAGEQLLDAHRFDLCETVCEGF